MIRRLRITIGALLAVMFLAAIGSVAFFYLRSQQVNNIQQYQSVLKAGLVENCERNGNPLRRAVQKLLADQIKDRNPQILQRFFPQIPPKELEALIAARTKSDERLIHRVRPINCNKVFR